MDGSPQRWRLDLCWDGRAYMGWQRQPHGPSVQAAVEEALQRVLGGRGARVEASGRTDAGVHALHQVAAFDSPVPRQPAALVRGLNHHLPADIACLAACLAPPGFDPRRWTRGKLYRYRILQRGPRCPFRHGQVLHYPQALDLQAMVEAARCLPGTHDMRSFQAMGCGAQQTVRRLSAARVNRVEDELQIELQGHGFLRHMVRIVAGSLVEVGRGAQAPGWLGQVLAARDRAAAGPTLAAHGLWLVEVDCPMVPRPISPLGEESGDQAGDDSEEED